MTINNYSLADYFKDADIFEFPSWFNEIRLRRKPWPHQIEDIKFCYQHERFGLFNDAGVGKTLPMQALLILYTAGFGNKGVVCMPPALIGQFMESFFDRKFTSRMYVVTRDTKIIKNVKSYPRPISIFSVNLNLITRMGINAIIIIGTA